MRKAQSAETVEYTDWISAEGKNPHSTSIRDLALNELMARTWKFGESEASPYCCYSQVHPETEW